MFKEIAHGLNAYADRLFARLVSINWDEGPGDYSVQEETTVERTYDKRRLLKIKLKSLMAEVKIIREQEEKLKPAARRGSAGAKAMIEEMAVHRRKDIRNESRATLLAYNFIRGRTYAQSEPNVQYETSFYVQKRVEKVVKMVLKYGNPDCWFTGKSASSAITAEVKVREWMGVDPSGARIVV